MENTAHGRRLLPDVLKGVAVLLMIQVHLTELFANQEFYNSLPGKISLFLGGPPAAPVFMAVMGYFLAKSNAGTLKLVFRGFKLIIYGFLLNTGLNLHLFYRIFIGEAAIDPLPYLFGVDILFLAGMSIILIALLRLAFRNSLALWLLMMLVIPAASLIIPSGSIGNGWDTYLLAYIYKATWWSYFPLLPWLAYPLAGYCFYLTGKEYLLHEISTKKILLAGLAFLIPVIIFFQYGFAVTVDLPSYYHHQLPYFLWVLIFLGVWLIAFRLIATIKPGNPVLSFLQWTGRNVTAFYVIQWLIIGNLATVLYKTVDAGTLLLWFIGITVATSLLVWLYRFAKKMVFTQKSSGLA